MLLMNQILRTHILYARILFVALSFCCWFISCRCVHHNRLVNVRVAHSVVAEYQPQPFSCRTRNGQVCHNDATVATDVFTQVQTSLY